MRKFLFALLAALLLVAARAEGENRPVYTVNAAYDAGAQALAVSVTAEYMNDTGTLLDEVYFCVYANVFRRESTLPFDNGALTEVFPDYYAPSGAAFSYVGFNGQRARYAFRGENECFLRVECDLEEDEKGVFRLDYTLLLSENRSFQGCGKDARLTLWLPQFAVHTEDGFILNAPSRAGDFAFSAPADWDITLTVPANYGIACGGVCEQIRSDKQISTFHIALRGANEAALVLSDRFYTETAETGDVRLTAFGSDRRELKKLLSQAEEGIALYRELFGAFPGENLTLVRADSAFSLSRPGILMLGDDWEEDGLLLVRLLARQYFTCAVNTDPSTDPFLTEGIAEYAALLSVEQRDEDGFRKAMREEIEPALRLTVPGGLTPDGYLSRFTTRSEYDIIVRKRGAAVLNELRDAMGREAFLTALRLYYENGRGKTVTIEAFVSALDSAAGKEMGPALINWLYTIGDYTNTIFDIYD